LRCLQLIGQIVEHVEARNIQVGAGADVQHATVERAEASGDRGVDLYAGRARVEKVERHVQPQCQHAW
jgi:hypothetical protein